MQKKSVLIIEDEENIASFVAMYLEKDGYQVDIAKTGSEGLARAAEMAPAVIILDIMLPDIDGFEVCRSLRRDSDVPIIMLTARDGSTDKVVGLELGADDYITKPFEPRELVARVKSVLRRAGAGERPGAETLSTGDITLDPDSREVTVAGKPVKLTAREFDVLHYLMLNIGLVMSRQQLLEKVWGFDFFGDTRTVDVHINQIRKKLGPTAAIETVWGVGYKYTG